MKREALNVRVEAEFKNGNLDTRTMTKTLQIKIQGKLRDIHELDEIDRDTYQKVYPSASVTPVAYLVIKPHKPEKNYSERPSRTSVFK